MDKVRTRSAIRWTPICVSKRLFAICTIVAMVLGLVVSERVWAQDATWIWSQQHVQGNVPIGPVHFRKGFSLPKPMKGELVIAADDEFQVYFNNQLVGYGNGYDQLTKIDLTPYLRDGDNLLAIRATNTQGNKGALASIARFRLENERDWRWLASDETWKSATQVDPSWKLLDFNDGRWTTAAAHGSFGNTRPWDDARMDPPAKKQTQNASTTAATTEATTAATTAATTNTAQTTPAQTPKPTETANTAQTTPAQTTPAQTQAAKPMAEKSNTGGKDFTVPENFVVQQIMDESVGSLIALEFNEFGQMLISREGGKLLLADLSDAESGEVNVRKCCDEIENVQGILPLNGDIFVTGDGPQGLGIYHLSDRDRDGMFEPIEKIVGFDGETGEHGPHGLSLGPDGMIYAMVGNASGLEGEFHSNSPVTEFYEGELLPRLNDPAGHATGIEAPGGVVIRVSPDGVHREIVCVGIRNSYDLAFNRYGDLFFHDSDMESDIGTPWYRPTQIFHVTAGAEYGWRSGTAKFPSYFIDTIPGIGDTGRGSPTGTVVYDHFMMPLRYHGALFMGDWSEGRILTARLKKQGDTWATEVSEFLSAQPLTVTDLAIGPDGALYFTTGGRGTEGGVYRVAYTGEVPEEYRLLDDKLSRLVGRPQPQSAWTRQEMAKLRAEMGDEWATILNGIINETRNDPNYRIRALETLNLYGPTPSDEFLTKLVTDHDPWLRSRAIEMIGWRTANELVPSVMQGLTDEDPRVRRVACESLRHMDATVSLEQIADILASTSPSEAMSARRLLEIQPIDQWRDQVLEHDNTRVFMQGATALMIVEPELENSYRILARCSSIMDEFVSDSDFVGLLRVVQLALDRGSVDPSKIPLFHDRMLAEFPTGNGILNRELSRIIGYLRDQRAGEILVGYLKETEDTDMDKTQVILNLSTIADKCDGDQRLAVIEFLETMRTVSQVKESNHSLYLGKMLEGWSGQVDEDQISDILRNGARWPSAALAAFYKLPDELTKEQVEWIIEIDRQLKGRTESTARNTRIGCIAVLGRSGDEESMHYLREVWRHESDRRNDTVLALAQQPDGPNWPYLISSLGELSDDSATEVIKQLSTVNKRPREPKFIRQAILTGYQLRDTGTETTSKLLMHWTGNQIEGEGYTWQTRMQAWAQWFNETYPDVDPITFNDAEKIGRYSVDEILSHIETDTRPAQVHNGRLAFVKAQCTNCHRFNGQGEALGPDLNSIARRFSTRESLRSILHPSEVISSQYRAKQVLTTDGKIHIGLVTEDNEDLIVMLDSKGDKISIDRDEIDQMEEATVSSMPEGLLDNLTLQEIRDLMGYLYSSTDRTANSGESDYR